ncbi:MAG: hypothetical protein A2131_02085 [Candidatus Sungbacteria bacterium GWC2_49_10]|uniref:AAA ATPase containing von Willebrand factor type A (VWA) protein-like protein omain n=2 Tax=Parcubacteria group TaxID=1794811 RepID=A0A0G1WQA9_9BACT|nr:MAG: AAA ATPase containing von Willebrand factor type A (VWA) protein-like protein omain [Parcubacteria group bacterium GW2011_GWB1_50_9]KKW21048.1 MAG: AAA ATPase containing von Willebrand factor type A (VWA) protein-like protein omain [Candidatus Adlerbacteria bacterium GW2011_GWC1_50_9]OGZ93302.1 MAG: hypothetical protein A2131_02085 [Candidatus Sungbacteria bacterium GWC2_49_10]
MAHKAHEFRLKKRGWLGPALFIVTATSLAFYLLFASRTPGASILAERGTNSQNGQREENPLFADPDEDGLKNWEEAMYGTNPDNADTDGNGISDRDEALAGIFSNENTEGSVLGTQSGDKSTNLTETLLEKFVTAGGAVALSKGKEGGFITSKLLLDEVERLSKEGALPRPVPILPLEKISILMSGNTSPDAVRDYLNTAAEILSRNSKDLKKDNLDLLAEILQSGDLGRLAEFARYRESADTIIRELSALRVPKNLSWYHERQIFLMSKMAEHIAIFEKTAEDPLKTLALVEPNINVKEELLTLNRNDLWTWLNNQKIVLKPEDKAYSIIY